jgi:hypothetical protein
MKIARIGATLTTISLVTMLVYAYSPEAIARHAVAEIGRLKLLSIIILTACLLSTRLVGPLGRKLILRVTLGLVLVTFFAVQGESVLDTYRNSVVYHARKTISLSAFPIVENLYHSSEFSGKNILPLLVADYMPRAKVFLYDRNLYSRELLSWSGRDPDSTFVIGGYQSTMDTSLKAACLARPHVLYRGKSDAALYIATPLSTYEGEERVFLMRDGVMDYLIPGSWGVSQH